MQMDTPQRLIETWPVRAAIGLTGAALAGGFLALGAGYAVHEHAQSNAHYDAYLAGTGSEAAIYKQESDNDRTTALLSLAAGALAATAVSMATAKILRDTSPQPRRQLDIVITSWREVLGLGRTQKAD
jgi:hypothetical protein